METTVDKLQEERILQLQMRMAIVRYVVVNAFLVFVNWMTSPHYWWVIWVIAGWGIGLLLKLINYTLESKIRQGSKK